MTQNVGIMNKQIKHLNKLSGSAVIDIYLSGGNGRAYWPNRLQPARREDSTPSVREACQSYMLDSGFKDGGVPTDQLIEMTHERQPEYVIPNDTVNLPGVPMRTAVEETAEKVASFLDHVDERTFPATILVPLQPPHDFHLAYLHHHYPRQAHRSHFALGGLKNAAPTDQLAAIRQFRAVVGADAYVHGFGLGSSRTLIETLRESPSLLDSVDFSTPQIHSRSGQIAGHARIPMRIGTAAGTDLSTTTAHLITAEMSEIARMLNPEISDEEIEIQWEKFNTQYERLGHRLEQEGIRGDETDSTAAEQPTLPAFNTPPESDQ